MMLFPNKIDKKTKTDFNKNGLDLPSYFFKRKYVKLYENLDLFIEEFKLISNPENTTEENLEIFLKCKQINNTVSTSNLNKYNPSVYELIKLGFSEYFSIENQNYLKELTEQRKYFSVAFLEKYFNKEEYQYFIGHPKVINYLKNDKEEAYLKEEKINYILQVSASQIKDYLNFFDLNFIFNNIRYLKEIINWKEKDYFDDIVHNFANILNKDEFFNNVKLLDYVLYQDTKTVCKTFINRLIYHPNEIRPFINNLKECSSNSIGIDNLAIKLSKLKLNKFYQDLTLDILKNLKDNYQRKNFIGSFLVVQQSSKQFLELIQNMPEQNILELQNYANITKKIKTMLKEPSLENYSTVLKESFLLPSLKDDYSTKIFEATVLKDFKKDIFNVHDPQTVDKFPSKTILYDNVPIKVITIDDYPFTLLVSAIVSKTKGNGIGTNDIAQKISSNPKLWMDENVKGQNSISMSRISEYAMGSWVPNGNDGVIVGFSNIYKNMINASYKADAVTSMNVNNEKAIYPADMNVANILYFKETTPFKYRDNTAYEEIRANRYLKGEDGQLHKYPPDYLVSKRSPLTPNILEWAKTYGQTIIQFDYQKIYLKAKKRLYEQMSFLQKEPYLFNENLQNKFIYTLNVLNQQQCACSLDVQNDYIELLKECSSLIQNIVKQNNIDLNVFIDKINVFFKLDVPLIEKNTLNNINKEEIMKKI